MATTERRRARVRFGAAKRPVVSASALNRVNDAAQARVDALEPRLAAIIETILHKAGTQAASRFHARVTRHPVPDASLVAAAANSDVAKTSTMIALKPRPAEAAALADPGGDPPEILHVTLAYLGDSDQPLSEIADALKPVAATHGPLSGVVGGVGMFHPAGVGIALPDARGLTEVRQGVVEALTDNGIDYSRDHGFTPHITINGDGETPDQDLGGQPLHFDSLHVVRGNDEEIELPLVGVRALTAAGPNWSPPFADELIDVDALIEQILAKTEPVRAALIEQTMTPALQEAGIKFDVSNPLTAKLFAETGSQVTNIAMTTRANLMDIIGKSYANGLTIPATRDLIQQGMKAASKTRATMIARTEMARAVNGGSLAATQLVEQATGQAYNKVWHTAPGAKYPRHELYDGLDGQTVGMDETFTVGDDQLQYPGDPNGEPGETINCRCTLTYTEVPQVAGTPAAPEPGLVDTSASEPLTPLASDDPEFLAEALHDRAERVEPALTKAMQDLAKAEGGELAGLAFRLKSEASTIDKIKADSIEKQISAHDAANEISDEVRYTVVFDPADYVTHTRALLDDLKSRGYEINRFRNTWSDGGAYKGINTQVVNKNGYRWELQFHTDESFKLKNDVNHKLYEQWRKIPDKSDPEAIRLDEQMTANANALANPPGVENFAYDINAPVPLVTPPVPAATPPTPLATPISQSIDIGITPFRAGEDNAVGFYDSAKYQQFIGDIYDSAQAYGVHIDSIDKVTGVWEGDTEPSVSLHVSATDPKPEDDTYKIQHRAPTDDGYNAPMWDLTQNDLYPPDIYSDKIQVAYEPKVVPAIKIYGSGPGLENADKAAFNVIDGVHGDPNAMVTIYRAAPENVTEINPGDWVTPVKSYAEAHADGNLGQDVKSHVISMQVPASQLYTDANSVLEWGWSPPDMEQFNVEARARAFAANLGRAYNQDGVLLFDPVPKGESAMVTFRSSLPERRVSEAMSNAGISGGRFTTDGRLQIIGSGPDFLKQVQALSKELGGIDFEVGNPTNLYEAMHAFTGPGSSYFNQVYVLTRNIDSTDQIRLIFQGMPSEVSESLKVPIGDVTDHEQMQLQQAFIQSSAKSLEDRGLADTVTVYGSEKPAPGEVQSYFLKPSDGLQPYTISRDDILVDMDAFAKTPSPVEESLHPERVKPPEQTNEVLVRGEALKPGGVPVAENPGAYDISRGTFSLLERDSGDYQKALDAFTHPKGVTAMDVPTAEPPPAATLPHGDAIPTESLSEQDKLINAPAQKEWLDNLPAMDTKGGRADALVRDWTQLGSRDINGYLAGHLTEDYEVEQFSTLSDVKNAAAGMREIVDSAPPLPDGTTLYRSISPQGVDPSLQDTFVQIEKEVMDRLGPGVAGDATVLSDRLSGFSVTTESSSLDVPVGKEAQTLLVKNAAGDLVGTVDYTREVESGTSLVGLPHIAKITIGPKYQVHADYNAEAMLARVYLDEGFNSVVFDDFETLDEAKFGVEMAVRNPSWVNLRVGTTNGLPEFWRRGEIDIDSLAFSHLDGAAKKALRPWMDKLIADHPDPHEAIFDEQTKTLGDWAAQRYPTGSYVAMGEPGEFESLTSDANFASNFQNPNAPGLVFRVVNAKTGAPIWPYSALNEHEVLAPPRTFYRVRDVQVTPMDSTYSAAQAGRPQIDRVVVTVEEVPTCSKAFPIAAAGGVTAYRLPCTEEAQYTPKGDKPPVTAANTTVFPGQSADIADKAAAHRDAQIAKYAADNNMSVADYKSAATEAIRSYIAQNPQIRIRTSHQALEAILQSGQYLSEFSDANIPPEWLADRAEAEKNLFGYSKDMPPGNRPVYGYLAGTADETGQVQEYGDIIMNLDPSVNARATFTIGDSYRAGLDGHLSPSLLSDPGIGSWDGSFDIVKAYRSGDIGQISRYVEVEIHGGLPTTDIGGVKADQALMVSREDAVRLKESVEAISDVYANAKGTQSQTEEQVQQQSGLPVTKPVSLDYAQALHELGKNAGLRQGALADLIARVGLKGVVADDFEDFNILGAIGEGAF